MESRNRGQSGGGARITMLGEIEKAPRAGGALSEMSSAGCLDNSEIKPPRQNTQIKFQDPAPAEFDAGITCGSMRAEELRACLVREIFRAALIGMQPQTALLDGDDAAPLANLRGYWIALRADISPLAGELIALRRAGAPP